MSDRPYLIAPSILSADMANLAKEISKAEGSGADLLHVDVMDGRFVPNITVGIPVVKSLRSHTGLPIDAHLMIIEPDLYIEDFVAAGADIVTVQAETCVHLHRTLRAMREAGAKPAVALNPATPLSSIEYVLEELDMVLIMTVEPGFGGQEFIEAMLPKIGSLARIIEERQLPVDIQVDGGINKATIGKVVEAGANVFVAGTAIFGHGDVGEAIHALRKAIAEVTGKAK